MRASPTFRIESALAVCELVELKLDITDSVAREGRP